MNQQYSDAHHMSQFRIVDVRNQNSTQRSYYTLYNLLHAIIKDLSSTTGWRRINRTIQTFNRSYENLHKITSLTLVSQRQIRRQKINLHLNILR